MGAYFVRPFNASLNARPSMPFNARLYSSDRHRIMVCHSL